MLKFVILIFTLSSLKVLCAPAYIVEAEYTDDWNKISNDIRASLSNATVIDDSLLNTLKNYSEEALKKISQRSKAAEREVQKLKAKITDIFRNVKDIVKGKVLNEYDDIVAKVGVHFNRLDNEVRNFLNDVKPNLDEIEGSIDGLFKSVTDNVESIWKNLIFHVKKVVGAEKKNS
ncbi:hypothetical protein FQA39_LY00845 [Lamprigera yunnana]|nr:hypothetical protein FQA39_LY00845 [Lamprigera yunnana]